MKVLLTGAEVRRVHNHYLVVYKERIVKNKLNKEEAIELALNLTLLERIYYGPKNRRTYD